MNPKLLQQVCALPTGPFLEQRVTAFIEQFARARRRLRLSRDPDGNLLLELPGRQRNLPRWVFVAHMDHPAFVSGQMLDNRTLEAEFRGYVLADMMPGTRVRFFTDEDEVPGRIESVEPDSDSPRARLARVRVSRPVEPGRLGMFDLVPARIRGDIFSSRAIDDVGGVAAALAMLDVLHRAPPRATVCALLTRAEEDGFIGAISAASRPRLLRKTDRIISIECSMKQPYAPQGRGPIIRVGDRTSIFNSGLTWFLTRQAEALTKADPSFKYQRALMPGGTCEATVFDAWGYTAAAMCVALGNYHNMDLERNRIAAEYINVNDWTSMVRLFVAVVRNGHDYREGLPEFKARVLKRFESLKHLLKAGR